MSYRNDIEVPKSGFMKLIDDVYVDPYRVWGVRPCPEDPEHVAVIYGSGMPMPVRVGKRSDMSPVQFVLARFFEIGVTGRNMKIPKEREP